MKRDRNVKIVATLGPASSTYEMIRALHEAGADGFRLNLAHGTHEEIEERHPRVIRDGMLASVYGDRVSHGCLLYGDQQSGRRMCPGILECLENGLSAGRFIAMPQQRGSHPAGQ